MPVEQPEVPARYYAHLLEILRASGVDVAVLLEAADLSLALLVQPQAVVRLSQVERLIAEASAMTGRTDLAFELGKALKLTSHSIVGYAMLSSPTIAYAMRMVMRYFRLIMPTFRMRCRTVDDRLEFIYEPVVSMTPDCMAFHLEAFAVATHVEVREMSQQRLPAYDLYISIAEPRHIGRYRELSEARLHFGWESTPSLRMSFPAEIGQVKLALADAAALAMAETRCRELARQVIDSSRVSDWIVMMLRETIDGMPSLSELASALSLSPRTLDRYLEKEGVSFRDLSRQVRSERAGQLLTQTTMPITQIALELGYSDPANFTRAFRREHGVSPTVFREDGV